MVWCLYDWAHTVWPVLIITFIFPYYFVENVAETPLLGNIYWANIMTVSGFATALIAPAIGLIADAAGNRMFWLRLFTLLNIICAYGIWFVEPSPKFITLTMYLITLGTVSFEVSSAFYNTLLSSITKLSQLSRISGIAWGLGYFSGIFCLIICLLTLVLPQDPLFGIISKDAAMNIRIIGPIVGTYYLIFALPLMLLTDRKQENRKSSISNLTKSAYQQFIHSISKAKQMPYILWFLICRMIYTDGINTLFMFAGIYAASVFDMSFEGIMYFAIVCNLSAGFGCFIASYVDSIVGEKVTIQISLLILTVLMITILFVHTLTMFVTLAVIATVFVGPVQTSSRSLMSKVTPTELSGEFFGLYALSGRITSFLGPMFLSLITSYTGSQKIGMSIIAVFLLFGLIGMYLLHIPKSVIIPQSPSQHA